MTAHDRSEASSSPAEVLLTTSSAPEAAGDERGAIRSGRGIGRFSIRRPSGSANTIVETSSGWTITMRPMPSAIAWAMKPTT